MMPVAANPGIASPYMIECFQRAKITPQKRMGLLNEVEGNLGCCHGGHGLV